MFVHAVTPSTVFLHEGALARSLSEGLIRSQITEAERYIQATLRNMRKEVRLYCTPSSLADEAVSTTSVTGTPVSQEIERSIWVSTVSDVTSSLTLTLLGANEEAGEYKAIESYRFTVPGESSPLFISGNNLYKYYRVDASGNGIYSSALYEDSFYYAVLNLVISNCFLALSKEPNDGYFSKYEVYRGKFESIMATMTPSYDSTEDGTIDPANEIRPVKATELLR